MALGTSFRPAILDRDGATLDPPEFMQSLHKSRSPGTPTRSVRTQKPNDRQLRCLLRARHERPRRSAAEQRDELAPLHSITSSARASSIGGIVRPSALAVIRFTTRSNLVGCSTGISPGFVPRKILSANSAARRNILTRFGP